MLLTAIPWSTLLIPFLFPRSFIETLFIMKMFIYIYNLMTVTLYVLMTQENLFLSSELISKWPPRILYNRQCCKEHLPIALQLWEAFSRVTHRVACWVIKQVAPPHHKILTNCSPQWQIRSNFCQLLIFLKLKMQSGVALLFYFAFLLTRDLCETVCETSLRHGVTQG